MASDTKYRTLLVHAIRLLRRLGPSLRNSRSKVLKHCNRAVPIDTRVCDGHALLEPARTLGRYLLVALVDI
jgi:hypothetical protein